METTQKLIGQTFAKNYKIIEKIGSGAFGQIYLCINQQNQEQLAMKIEPTNTQFPQIQFEGKLYMYLQNDLKNTEKHIPRIHYFGTDNSYNILVLDKLGKSLEDLFNSQKKKFSLKTVCMLADQMITRIEFIHTKYFLHRDIKPDNFMVGVGQNEKNLYIIDFGLSKRYLSKDGKHLAYKTGKSLTGTARYASINTHLGCEQSRRDDMESIGYVLVYFLRGILPWQNLKATTQAEKYKRITEKKMQTPLDVLCKGFPVEITRYLNYCKNLKFEEKPDYNFLKSLFWDIMKNNQIEYDYQYDWTSLKINRETSLGKNQSNPPKQQIQEPINNQSNKMINLSDNLHGIYKMDDMFNDYIPILFQDKQYNSLLKNYQNNNEKGTLPRVFPDVPQPKIFPNIGAKKN